jgi:hypothetical protein
MKVSPEEFVECVEIMVENDRNAEEEIAAENKLE